MTNLPAGTQLDCARRYLPLWIYWRKNCPDASPESMHCCLTPPFPSNLVLWLQGQQLTPLLQNKSLLTAGVNSLQWVSQCFLLGFLAFVILDSVFYFLNFSLWFLVLFCLSLFIFRPVSVVSLSIALILNLSFTSLFFQVSVMLPTRLLRWHSQLCQLPLCTSLHVSLKWLLVWWCVGRLLKLFFLPFLCHRGSRKTNWY